MSSPVDCSTVPGKLQGLQDLCQLWEQFSEQMVFDSTRFIFVDADYNVYSGTSPKRLSELSLEEVNDLLELVPDEFVYPEPTPGVTLLPNNLLETWYLKGPMLQNYEDIRIRDLLPSLPIILLGEAKILETLKEHPHPNLVEYHGCVVTRGRITGIVLTKYPTTLKRRIQEDPRPFDTAACMRQIESAIEHLHGLGLAHNDLNPSNVMVDSQDTAIVIDFGSCRAAGELLHSGGTRGWIEEDSFISDLKHDIYALGRIREWMNKERVSQEEEAEDKIDGEVEGEEKVEEKPSSVTPSSGEVRELTKKEADSQVKESRENAEEEPLSVAPSSVAPSSKKTQSVAILIGSEGIAAASTAANQGKLVEALPTQRAAANKAKPQTPIKRVAHMRPSKRRKRR